MIDAEKLCAREEVARTILDRRGFGFADTPEDGQNAYDITCETLDEADAILALFGAKP